MHGLFRISKAKVNIDFPTNNWFDIDCKEAKAKLNHAIKSIASPNEINIYRREYRRIIQMKKRQYHESQAKELDNLCITNPQKCWKFWKKLKGTQQNTNIDIETFTHYYKQNKTNIDEKNASTEFLTKIESLIDEIPVQSIKSNPLIFDIMESPINLNEVQYALRYSKNNRACGDDGIPVEFYKLWDGAMDQPLTALFNHILQLGEYPSSWSTGIINPIYKKKAKNDP